MNRAPLLLLALAGCGLPFTGAEEAFEGGIPFDAPLPTYDVAIPTQEAETPSQTFDAGVPEPDGSTWLDAGSTPAEAASDGALAPILPSQPHPLPDGGWCDVPQDPGYCSGLPVLPDGGIPLLPDGGWATQVPGHCAEGPETLFCCVLHPRGNTNTDWACELLAGCCAP
jgi:hypothetical protein